MAGKICSKCNEQFNDSVLFCKYCGLPTTSSADGIQLVESNKSRKVVLPIVMVIVVIVLIAIYLLMEL